MLFVFDTNILVSAILKPFNLPASAVRHAQTIGKLIFSSETEKEFREVIACEKFNKYIPVADRLISVNQIFKQTESKRVSLQLFGVCEDTSDLKFLNLAVEHRVDCIVSGDRHLLILNPFHGIPIVLPADFLKMF